MHAVIENVTGWVCLTSANYSRCEEWVKKYGSDPSYYTITDEDEYE